MIHPYTYAGTFKNVTPSTVTIKTLEYGHLIGRSQMLDDILNPSGEERTYRVKSDDIYREVMGAVSKYYGISEQDINAECRKRDIVKARQVAMYMCLKFGLSTVDTGRRMNKHHSSVIHSNEVVRDMMIQDKVFTNEVAYLFGKLSQTLKSK